ncbi:hypothetical protein [Tenacibaculum jejuense]|uniref:Uncharacterized protein n=1 Tax=Tenacibaculum jejuense TaxID=584609 RepID=A0A238U495_9FLAO|nr:hypothetical protein [Tenacibaculum jejuense]SNR13957.1 protein of unknown function [Tenacibaculum jejuense]
MSISLNTIHNKLEEQGYKSFVRKNDNEKWIIAGIHGSNTNFKFGSAFQIRITQNQILLSYLVGQSAVNKDFTSSKELFKYLKEKFTIE